MCDKCLTPSLVASYELLPLLVGDAGLVELALASGELREAVLQEPAVVVPCHLRGGDVEVEGAGDAREGRGACYEHMMMVVEVEVEVKKKLTGRGGTRPFRGLRGTLPSGTGHPAPART